MVLLGPMKCGFIGERNEDGEVGLGLHISDLCEKETRQEMVNKKRKRETKKKTPVCGSAVC